MTAIDQQDDDGIEVTFSQPTRFHGNWSVSFSTGGGAGLGSLTEYDDEERVDIVLTPLGHQLGETFDGFADFVLAQAKAQIDKAQTKVPK